MTDDRPYLSEIGKVRRLVAWGLVRALLTTVVVVALFYLLPLDNFSSVPWGITVTIAMTILLAVGAWEVRAVLVSPNPLIREIEALAAIVPLFIVLFAAMYFVMARSDPGNFNVQDLDRTDTLYFTVTIFSTVGFGDIVATSTNGRIVVMLQMVLDLALIGLGVRALTGAVRLGRARASAPRRDQPRE